MNTLKEDLEQLKINAEDLSKKDALYNFIEIEYERSHCDGQCDYICRCTEIYGEKVESIDVIKLTNELTKGIDNEFIRYCVDRIVQKSYLTDKDSWEVLTCSGYYGTEIDGVYLIDKKSFIQTIQEFALLETDFDRLSFILKLEYGYILPVLTENKYGIFIKRVLISQVNLGNEQYMRKLDSKNLEFFKDYSLPRAVCFKTGTDSYRLIDGYHRTTAAIQNKLEEIKIICLTKI